MEKQYEFLVVNQRTNKVLNRHRSEREAEKECAKLRKSLGLHPQSTAFQVIQVAKE